jgi:site-specific DNA-methyltransferase (adenine-specific)
MTPTDILGNIKLYNADCMEVMKTFKDKQFDLAIVDPPYGIDITESGRLGRYNANKKKWDSNTPDRTYFNELFRVSKTQIIWGGNYFDLPPTRCFLIWDKQQPENVSFASCEFAWTNMDSSAKTFYMRPQGIDEKYRIHPTQKPVQLYKWLLQNYAKEGDSIIDTHFGSLSIGIACHDMKFDLTAIELDKDYYEMAKQRLINHQRQLTIF